MPRSCVQRDIKWFIEKLKLCYIVTNMEHRIILWPREPAQKIFKMFSQAGQYLLGEVGGKLVVEEDLAVERLGSECLTELKKI